MSCSLRSTRFQERRTPPPPSTSPGMLLDQDHYPTFSIFYGVDRLAIDCFLLMFFHSFRRVVTFWLFWYFNLFGFFSFCCCECCCRRPDEGSTLDRSKKLFRVVPPFPSPPLPADAEEPLTVSLDQLTPLVLYKDRLLLIGRGPIVTSSIPAVHSLPYIWMLFQ